MTYDLSLPESVWTATSPTGPSYLPLTGEHKADVIVVGGGFTGLSAALHLATAGTNVVLLEASEPGWGASGRNGGQVIPGMKLERNRLIEKFGQERGEQLWLDSGKLADGVFDLIERHNIDCDHRRCGWVQPAHAKAAMVMLEQRAEDWGGTGAPVEILDRDQTANLLGTDRYVGGYLDKRGGRINPLAFARGLARAAIQAGATIHAWSMVNNISQSQGVWTVSTAHGSVTADTVLLATNAYTNMDTHAPELAALARTVIPIYSYQIATKPLSDNIRRSILPQGHVASDTRRLLAYFSIDSKGRFLMGGRGGNRGKLTANDFGYVHQLTKELYPQIGGTELDFAWNGQVALTLDHMPHRLQLAPGLIAGLGYNGRGVTTATAMGKALAQMAQADPESQIIFPRREMRSIPMHSLRGPAVAIARTWKAWCDNRERRAS